MNHEGEYLVISSSLAPSSRSRILAEQLVGFYAERQVSSKFLDLRQFALPFCDGDAAYEHPNVASCAELISAARVIVTATPIYNFTVNAALKNLIELTGSAWENKVVGFLCAAGGDASYMSVLSLANSLMLDFRCLILPRFVYATGTDFLGERLASDSIKERIAKLGESTLAVRYEG